LLLQSPNANIFTVPKRLLMAGGLVLAAIVMILGLAFVYRTSSRLLSILRPRVPADIKKARVVVGNTLVSKSLYYRDPSLNVVTDIEQGDDGNLVIAGETGAVFLNLDLHPSSTVHYPRCMSDVVVVPLKNGRFLCRGSWSQDTTLFDVAGQKVLSYGARSPGIDDTAGGVMDGAGVVVVGLNGSGGVVLLNSQGHELWKEPGGNIWHVEIVAPDNGGDNVILHSDAKGQLTQRDAGGKILAHYTAPTYVSHFSMTSWIDHYTRNKLITASRESLYVLAMDGSTLARLPAPGTAAVDEAKGTAVHFPGKAVAYAALVPRRIWNRSVLYMYDRQNQLIYQEVLDHNCGALFAHSNGNGGEDLFVGCDGAVWKYTVN
jgi:hypothetical protein